MAPHPDTHSAERGLGGSGMHSLPCSARRPWQRWARAQQPGMWAPHSGGIIDGGGPRAGGWVPGSRGGGVPCHPRGRGIQESGLVFLEHQGRRGRPLHGGRAVSGGSWLSLMAAPQLIGFKAGGRARPSPAWDMMGMTRVMMMTGMMVMMGHSTGWPRKLTFLAWETGVHVGSCGRGGSAGGQSQEPREQKGGAEGPQRSKPRRKEGRK